MPLVHEVVREREPGRAHANHQHAVAAGSTRQRVMDIERIPACEQRIDLEPPRQFEYILERSRFGLRNIHRFLLLVDAGFHAVIADTVAGGSGQRIVDRDDRQRGDRIARDFQRVKLGNLFFQRATGQRHAKRTFLERDFAFCVRFFLQPGRARILALVVAPDAVIGLGERPLEIGARVGQRKTVATADMFRLDGEGGDALGLMFLRMRHQILRVELGGRFEQHTGVNVFAASLGVQRPGGVAHSEIKGLLIRCFVLEPRFHMLGVSELTERATETDRQLRFQCTPVERGGCVGFVPGRRLALHELALDVINRGELIVTTGQRQHLVGDTEEPRDKTIQMRSNVKNQRRLIFFRKRSRIGAPGCKAISERRIGQGKLRAKSGIDFEQAVALIKVGEGEAVGKFQWHGIFSLSP